jgi:iron(III) transport system substrate-binding protein
MNLLANRYLTVFGALAATVCLPFLLRPRGDKHTRIASVNSKPLETLVVLTPHVESIRREFSIGFAEHMAREHSRRVEIEWRTPGGTSEIDRYLDTEFRAAFEAWWKGSGKYWSPDLASVVSLSKVPEDLAANKKEAREEFLKSNVGVKIDVFFGGGVYDFERQKKKGYLVPSDSTGIYGFVGLQKQYPEWFTDAVIPASFSGDVYRDPQLCWVGSCLSSFGILYNKDTLERKSIPEPPKRWADLASPAYTGSIALADPSKSASVGKAFEMILQQEIQRSMASVKPRNDDPVPPGTILPPETPEAAVREGWVHGLQLIQKIGANARYFTDSGPKPPGDVARGDAAAGMCIDFYGRTYVEKLTQHHTYCRVAYVTPEGGSAVSVDPIAMFRGSQQPELATKFLEFVLSKPGQRLWAYKAGEPGGPTRVALRRQSVRKDMYAVEERLHCSDPDERPYETTTFVYKSELTSPLFGALRVIIKAMCIDTHDELRDAWKALQKANFPTQATAAMQELTAVGYDKVASNMTKTMNSTDKLAQAKLASDLAAIFRGNYERARQMAEAAR